MIVVVVVTVQYHVKLLAWVTDGSEPADLMDKDDLVHDMESVSPRSHEDNLPVSQQRILKFELQLYKKDSHYLLDVQVRFLWPITHAVLNDKLCILAC